MEIRKIRTNDIAYHEVESLILSSFPADERRDLDMQRDFTDHNSAFSCCAIELDGQFVGLLNFWDFDNFRYIEHFAIREGLRNAGIGALALEKFIKMGNSPVVLEVETPTDELTRRRVGFYQRNGFNLWDDCEYVQPPYRKGGAAVKMKLMAAGEIGQESFEEVKTTLYRHVYHV